MRDLQLSSLDGLGAVKQNIQIDETRAFGELFLATHSCFDRMQRFQKRERLQICFPFHHAIQKPRLVEKIHRLSFIKRRDLAYERIGWRKRGNRGAKIGCSVAKI